jgi:hypothetical protein
MAEESLLESFGIGFEEMMPASQLQATDLALLLESNHHEARRMASLQL